MDLHGTAAGGEEIMMQEVVDQINKCVLAQLENVHTAIPGEIKEYDPDKGVATVQPKAKFKKPDGTTLDYPEISGVPVVFPQSQKVTVAWAVKKGDGCLLIMSERSLDYWMYDRETDTELAFDLSNAIAIPGLSPKGNATMKIACDEDGVAIAADSTKVKITPKITEVNVNGTKLTVSSSKEAQVKAGGTTLTINSFGVTIVGNLTVKGGIVARDDVKASNGTLALLTHKHTDPLSGETGTPIP
jgi:hypothetical protein